MLKSCKLLFKNAPTSVVIMFVMSVVLMNLLANKEIATGVTWLALDCGTIVSWISFFSMDMLTKRFGARASIIISTVAIIINLMVCIVLFVASKIPGNWGEYYTYNNQVVNTILDTTIGGTWYVLLGSSIAFFVSSIVNSLMNAGIGKWLVRDTLPTYIARSWGSTIIAQFVDNMVFALLVSHVFFGWSFLQCVTCAATGCVVELLCQVIFTPIGFRITQRWEREGIGKEYLEGLKCE